jgi:hypothetical protein
VKSISLRKEVEIEMLFRKEEMKGNVLLSKIHRKSLIEHPHTWDYLEPPNLQIQI